MFALPLALFASHAGAAPGEEAYQAALVNFGMIANGVWTTAQAVEAMSN